MDTGNIKDQHEKSHNTHDKHRNMHMISGDSSQINETCNTMLQFMEIQTRTVNFLYVFENQPNKKHAPHPDVIHK